jgi:hypothetical protein
VCGQPDKTAILTLEMGLGILIVNRKYIHSLKEIYTYGKDNRHRPGNYQQLRIGYGGE